MLCRRVLNSTLVGGSGARDESSISNPLPTLSAHQGPPWRLRLATPCMVQVGLCWPPARGFGCPPPPLVTGCSLLSKTQMVNKGIFF